LFPNVPQNEPQKIHKYRLETIGAVDAERPVKKPVKSRNHQHHFMLNSNVVQSHSNNLYRSFITTIKRIKQSAPSLAARAGKKRIQ